MNHQEKSLQIGQVIYVLSNVKQKIVPAIVVEEIVVKKIDGNQVSWKVSVGPPGKEKIVDSNRLDGDIYSSLDEIRDVLYKRLSSFLDDLVAEAEKRVESWYGHQVSKGSSVSESSNVSSGREPDKIAPENLLTEFESHSASKITQHAVALQNQEKEKAREELRKKLSGEEPETQNGTILESEYLELPDGRKVKVNLRG